MPNDPIRFVWRNQLIEIESGEASTMLNQLSVQTRRQVFAPHKAHFDRWVMRWQYYANLSGFMRELFEVAGGTDIPRQSRMSSLVRRSRQIERSLAPRTIDRFFNDFPSWYRDSMRFCNDMTTYVNRFEEGGARTVRVLEFTRDRSFEALQVLATIASGGTAGPAGAALRAAAQQTAGRALVQNAAVSFVTRGVRDCAGNLGNAMAGTPVSGDVVLDQIRSNALSSVSDAMLGEILGFFARPLTSGIKALTEQAIRRGQFGSAVTMELVRGKLESVIWETIQEYLSRRAREIRRMIEKAIVERNAAAMGQRGASILMGDRNFKTALQRNLENLA